jgi:hypothetical protein
MGIRNSKTSMDFKVWPLEKTPGEMQGLSRLRASVKHL